MPAIWQRLALLKTSDFANGEQRRDGHEKAQEVTKSWRYQVIQLLPIGRLPSIMCEWLSAIGHQLSVRADSATKRRRLQCVSRETSERPATTVRTIKMIKQMGESFQGSRSSVQRLATGLVAVFVSALLVNGSARGESVDFRGDWRFAKGEQAGAEAAAFDDSSWATVRLPHDWAIAGPFNPEENGFAGKLPWRGVGWYRKTFTLDHEPGTRVYLDFDGVMAFPKVYVNGKLAGEWDYGYTSFRIDATPHVNLKGSNVIAVRVDTTKHGTRWYPGAGIYRKVMLDIYGPVHIGQWATRITTPEISDATATVLVQTTVENHTDKAADAVVDVVIQHPDPIRSAQTAGNVVKASVPAGGVKDLSIPLTVREPVRWDIDDPKLYKARVSLHVVGSESRPRVQSIHDEVIPFGIREFKFTADDGFHLNGRRVQLYGVNLHHDHGALGAAFYRRAMERQLEIMREMGVNAIRTSHNAPAPELLELCDRMGFVVWDECFDKWDDKADRVDGRPSLQEHAERHLRSLVMRDRNHPSVVIWSIANEIGGVGGRDGLTKERVAMMRDIVRKYDDTRPVGLGHHIPEHASRDIFDPLDLTGWNYDRRYHIYRDRYPDKPIVYSESASALSTRGFFALPLPTTKTDFAQRQHQVDSYDFNAAPWSDIADREFKLMQDDPFVAGEFVWTGFDYLGEPTPFDQQAKSSYFGIVDLAGIPKDRYFLYRSYWRPDTATVHIVPHWNWPERVGQTVPVWVYTNGDSAELFLNGKSLGRRKKGMPAEQPKNLAQGRTATANSNGSGQPSDKAADGDETTSWSVTRAGGDPWWQVDLGETQSLKCFVIEFEQEAKYYGYVVSTSEDGTNWRSVVEQRASGEPRWGGPRAAVHHLDGRGRYVRVEFNELPRRGPAGMREFGVYSQPTELSYYAPTYDYRLRWNDVVYEPGELKAVAYKDGNEIGASVVRTAGEPAALRLTPDRTQLEASGDDLGYVLVEALDEQGTLCPLADNVVHFRVEGPAEIAGVDNGNPLSLEPFQADERKLFYGKAMLILRTVAGQGGEIRIVATSDGLRDATASCAAAP
jgi:beta-galactosidase